MELGGYVYITTNKINTVLYTGVTSDLKSRIYEHIIKFYKNSFSARYNCTKLVYYCFYGTIKEAIYYEKYIKGKKREYKIKLINDLNPNWIDLYEHDVKNWV